MEKGRKDHVGHREGTQETSSLTQGGPKKSKRRKDHRRTPGIQNRSGRKKGEK